MMLKRLVALAACMVVAVPLVYGQTTVTGVVTDAPTGSPLPGANIVVKGTTVGTTTNTTGAYTLNISNAQDTLVFSFLGYLRHEEPIGGRSEINVALQPDVIEGEELVVVGYGTQRSRVLTGSVSSVDADELEGIPVANTGSLIQGRMAGVTVNSYAPQPGRDDAEIRIRGIGTFEAGQNPLVIIDGVTSSVTEFGRLQPSDIEDVTVLKDAASAAIYGARAANGVILVQTRQGQRDTAPQVTFSSTLTRQTPLIRPDMLDSWDYATTVNAWRVAEGSEPIYTDEMIRTMREGSDPDRFANTNWFDEVVRPAPMQEYYLSVAGGTSGTRYMLSADYRDQEGILMGTSSNRIGLRSNVDVDITDYARVGFNLSGYRQEVNQPQVVSPSGGGDNSLIYMTRRFAKPTVPVRYSSGEWGTVDGVYDQWGFPMTNLVEATGLGENQEDMYNVTANLSGAIDLLDNLTVQTRASGSYNSSVWSAFSPTRSGYDWAGNVVSNNPTNSLRNNNYTGYRLLNANTVTYSPEFGRHAFTILGGQSTEYYRRDYFYGYAEAFPNNNIRELGAGVENRNVDGWAEDYSLLSFFGRTNYALDDKYLLEANVRYDGSSRFSEGNRFAFFPSFSAGWVASSEPFLENVDFVSFMKLRGSWGRLGNQEIGYYPYNQTYATGQNYIIGGELVGGAAITSLANSDITWETTTMTDLGLDLHLFSSRLRLVADYFDKRTTDILLRLPIPGNQGSVAAPYQNVGEVQNVGVELAANYSHSFSEDFTAELGFNVSRIRNKVLDLGERGDNELGGWISGSSVVVEGEPMYSYYGYIAEGYFQSQDEIDNHAQQFGSLAPGDVKFRDINNDGVIDSNDRTIIGSPFPDYTFGMNLGASYGGFSVSAFLQGLAGIERFNWYNNELESRSSFTTSILDRWTEDNRDAQFPRFGNWSNNNATSTYWLEDASYVRLKNLQIAYTLPANLTERLSVGRMQVYLAGYNLLTFSPMNEFDPERVSGDDRNYEYPGLKNYALGLQLTL